MFKREKMIPKPLFMLLLVFVLLLGYVDYVTGWQLSFTVFYLFPILAAA